MVNHLIILIAILLLLLVERSVADGDLLSIWGNTVISTGDKSPNAGGSLEFMGGNFEGGVYNVWVVAAGEGDASVDFKLRFASAGVAGTQAITVNAVHHSTGSVYRFVSEAAAKRIYLAPGNLTVKLSTTQGGLIYRRIILVREPGEQPDPTSAQEALQHMGMGINLGTTFEKDNSRDTSPEHIGPLLQAWWDMGYRNLRVPVKWGRGLSRVPIGSDLFNQIAYAVDTALALGFYVVLNSHNDDWLAESYDGSDAYNNDFDYAWKQIALAFADRGPRLMFEVMNEPHNKFGQWIEEVDNFFGAKDPTSRQVDDPVAIGYTRTINDIGYWAIRSVSEDRIIFVEPNGYGALVTLGLVYPSKDLLPGYGEDGRLAMSVHNYNPQEYVFYDTNNNWWDTRGGIPGMQSFLQSANNQIQDWIDVTGVGVWVSEYGIGRTDPGTRESYNFRMFYGIQSMDMESRGWAGSVFGDVGWFSVTHLDGSDFGYHDAIFGALAYYSS